MIPLHTLFEESKRSEEQRRSDESLKKAGIAGLAGAGAYSAYKGYKKFKAGKPTEPETNKPLKSPEVHTNPISKGLKKLADTNKSKDFTKPEKVDLTNTDPNSAYGKYLKNKQDQINAGTYVSAGQQLKQTVEDIPSKLISISNNVDNAVNKGLKKIIPDSVQKFSNNVDNVINKGIKRLTDQ